MSVPPQLLTVCYSALFSLYLPYLPILETKTGQEIQQDHDLRTALTALRFAAQLSVDISCKANVDMLNTAADKGGALKFVSAPAPPTCYLAVRTYATLRKIFPEEWQTCQAAMEAKYESLRIFARRWGIAGRSGLAQTLDEFANTALRKNDVPTAGSDRPGSQRLPRSRYIPFVFSHWICRHGNWRPYGDLPLKLTTCKPLQEKEAWTKITDIDPVVLA